MRHKARQSDNNESFGATATCFLFEIHSRTKKKKIYVISTPKRPVPLQHFLYTGNSNKTSSELFMIVDANSKFLTRGYDAAIEAKKEREGKGKGAYGSKTHQPVNVREVS